MTNMVHPPILWGYLRERQKARRSASMRRNNIPPQGGADTGHAPIKRQHRAGNRRGDTHQQSHHPKTGGTRCTGVIPTGTATPPIQARMVYTTLRSSGGNLEERGELFPRLAPYSYNTGIAISPLFLELLQRLQRLFRRLPRCKHVASPPQWLFGLSSCRGASRLTAGV